MSVGKPQKQRETRLLDAQQPGAVAEAARLLQAGEVIVFPTDTVYGVGASAFDNEAIGQLYAVKERPFDKAIPLLISDIAILERLVTHVPEPAAALMTRFWPGALTLVFPKKGGLPPNLSPNGGIALRMPDHPLTLDLIRAAGGAVAATSANLTTQPPALTADEALAALGGRVTAVLDGGRVPVGQASTVVDCQTPNLKILREGPLGGVELGIMP